MKSHILYLFTRTPLHVGAGSSIGAIDQPVQRERHTGFPIIPGSSVKGVLRHYFTTDLSSSDQLNLLFGQEGKKQQADSDETKASAGRVSFGEARLIAFPVRSAKGAYALAVSPLTLSRLSRDAGWNLPIPEAPPENACYSGNDVHIQNTGASGVVLEEYRFERVGEFDPEWAKKLCSLFDDPVLESAAGRFVLLSDSDLSYFAVNACTISQHVQIDALTGTSKDGHLFNEETVPSETLFYSALTATHPSVLENDLFQSLREETLFQFGGNSTTGLGFCSVKLEF